MLIIIHIHKYNKLSLLIYIIFWEEDTVTNKVGFDFDEFGGNFDIVIVKENKDKLTNSTYMQSLHRDWQFKQLEGQDWSFFEGIIYPSEGIVALAQELSKEFSTETIYFYFGDASGWMGYQLFVYGEEKEEYSFGVSYEEEMMEMGIDLAEQTGKEGTVVATNEQDQQFMFWSRIRTQTENEICTGEKFIDEFLRSHKAYLGWDLFPDS